MATAIVTSAMLRTWPVRFEAIELTLSVRSFQVPATPNTCAWPAQLAFGADLARHARHFRGEGPQLLHHGVHGFFELQNLAFDVNCDLSAEVTAGDRGGNVGDIADLSREIRGH